MQTIWVVVADEGRARFLELREPGQDLRDVEELTDAAAHADRADLRRDAQGRFHGPGGQQGPGSGTAPPRTDELDKEADLFARRVAERLVDAHRKHRYEQLRIVAAPRFLGRLRQQLQPEVKDVVLDELDKDLVHLDERTLTQRLFPSSATRH
jgi:protein required for attachment to host cells